MVVPQASTKRYGEKLGNFSRWRLCTWSSFGSLPLWELYQSLDLVEKARCPMHLLMLPLSTCGRSHNLSLLRHGAMQPGWLRCARPLALMLPLPLHQLVPAVPIVRRTAFRALSYIFSLIAVGRGVPFMGLSALR